MFAFISHLRLDPPQWAYGLRRGWMMAWILALAFVILSPGVASAWVSQATAGNGAASAGGVHVHDTLSAALPFVLSGEGDCADHQNVGWACCGPSACASMGMLSVVQGQAEPLARKSALNAYLQTPPASAGASPALRPPTL